MNSCTTSVHKALTAIINQLQEQESAKEANNRLKKAETFGRIPLSIVNHPNLCDCVAKQRSRRPGALY